VKSNLQEHLTCNSVFEGIGENCNYEGEGVWVRWRVGEEEKNSDFLPSEMLQFVLYVSLGVWVRWRVGEEEKKTNFLPSEMLQLPRKFTELPLLHLEKFVNYS
jgi:hypothetical protein